MCGWMIHDLGLSRVLKVEATQLDFGGFSMTPIIAIKAVINGNVDLWQRSFINGNSNF
jgi:hypothetical protein